MTEPVDPRFNLSLNIDRVVPRLQPTTPYLVHYTSLDAFYKIFETGRFLLASVRSLNDPSEFVFGTEAVSQALRALLDRAGTDFNPEESTILKFAHQRLSSRQFRPFVFCMTGATHDQARVGDLSQWRLYGANGRGIAIVLDATHRLLDVGPETLGLIPRKILYGQAECTELVQDVISQYFLGLRDIPPSPVEEIQPIGGEYLLNALGWLPSVIKNEAYRHEAEVRFVRGDVGTHPAALQFTFHDRNGIRRPAVFADAAVHERLSEMDVRTHSPIVQIIVGPSADRLAVYDSASYFLEVHHWRVPVVLSDLPYRAL